MILLSLFACGSDPEVNLRNAPWCDPVNENDEYCDESLMCCTADDCWFVYQGREYYCTSRWDCDGAALAMIADSCE